MKLFSITVVSMAACFLFLSGCQRREAKLRATDNMTQRMQVVEAITDTPEAVDCLPALLDCLRNDNNNPIFRGKVIIALNQVGSAGADSLFKACDDDAPKVRSGVIRSFGQPNPKRDRRFTKEDEERAFLILTRAIEDPSPDVRSAAAEAFFHVSLGSGQEELALPYLVKALSDPSSDVRSEAARSIAKLARKPIDRALFRAAVPRLAALCTDKETSLRHNGAWALGEIGGEAESAAPALVRALLDDDKTVRNAASDSLGCIGRRARARVLPLLADAIRNTKAAPQRLHILFTLREIGSLPRSIAPLLAPMLKDHSPDVQRLAAIVLGEMGSSARDALPTLRAAIEAAPLPAQISMSSAIYKISGDRRQLVHLAKVALDNQDKDIRELALDLLDGLQPPAKELATVLARMASDDPDESVRRAAERGLRHIPSP